MIIIIFARENFQPKNCQILSDTNMCIKCKVKNMLCRVIYKCMSILQGVSLHTNISKKTSYEHVSYISYNYFKKQMIKENIQPARSFGEQSFGIILLLRLIRKDMQPRNSKNSEIGCKYSMSFIIQSYLYFISYFGFKE